MSERFGSAPLDGGRVLPNRLRGEFWRNGGEHGNLFGLPRLLWPEHGHEDGAESRIVVRDKPHRRIVDEPQTLPSIGPLVSPLGAAEASASTKNASRMSAPGCMRSM